MPKQNNLDSSGSPTVLTSVQKQNILDSSGIESEKRSSEHASLSFAQSSSTKLVSRNTFASLVCEPVTSTNQVNPDKSSATLKLVAASVSKNI